MPDQAGHFREGVVSPFSTISEIKEEMVLAGELPPPSPVQNGDQNDFELGHGHPGVVHEIF